MLNLDKFINLNPGDQFFLWDGGSPNSQRDTNKHLKLDNKRIKDVGIDLRYNAVKIKSGKLKILHNETPVIKKG